jgi:8-oxo-dGTP pyrophosphatase MutT (NUDIX family)
VDDGEDPEAAAKRELLEETGHVASRWSYVGKLLANPARQTNSLHVFVAEILEVTGEQDLDESEEMTWQFLSEGAIEEAIENGEFSQALHVASLWRAQRYLHTRAMPDAST